MVNFGGYLKAVQSEQSDKYIVPYNSIKELVLEGNHDDFETQWNQALQHSNADFSQDLSEVWTSIFEGLDADEARGAPLGTALARYVQTTIPSKAQGHLRRMVRLHTVAVSNTEALRKLVKKQDKMQTNDSFKKSRLLLPRLYSSHIYMSLSLLESSANSLRTLLDSEEEGKEGGFTTIIRNDSEAIHQRLVDQRMEEFEWLSRLVQSIPAEQLSRLVAHRGFHHIKDRSDKRPLENSLAAYEIAWTNGIHLCECDIALTKDEKLVLAHDADFSRLALLGKKSNRKVSDMTFRELMSLPLKTGMRPPLLIDVLQSAHAISEHAQLVIEIKPGNAEAASALARLLIKHPELRPCVAMIMSFDAFTMHRLRRELFAMSEFFNTNDIIGGVSSVTISRLGLATHASNSNNVLHRRSVSVGHHYPGPVVGGVTIGCEALMPLNDTGAGSTVRWADGLSEGIGMSWSQNHLSSNGGSSSGLGFLGVTYPSDHSLQQQSDIPPDAAVTTFSPKAIHSPKNKPSPSNGLPRLMLLTVADTPKKACELQVSVADLSPVESWLTGEHGTLDGVYLQFEQKMLTDEGAAALRELGKRYFVGVWGYSGRDPDEYANFEWLISQGDVTYVNTDLPTNFRKGFHKRSTTTTG